MEEIAVSDNDVVPLSRVATGVIGLRILFVNVFAVTAADGNWTLVDAGLSRSAEWIRRWAKEYFGKKAPNAIVLTHAHFDHVGALQALDYCWHFPVYAHQEELPYLSGDRAYPPPDPSVGGGIMARLSPLYPRQPLDFRGRLEALPADGTVPTLPGWRWIHTPGHTAGHVSLFRELGRTLIVGDAFCTTKQESLFAVATQRPELHGPPAYYTTDWEAARASVKHLASLQPACIAPGHGAPMAGEAITGALQLLADRFDEIARPAHGRYVDHPKAM